MSSEQHITLRGDDGTEHVCRVLGVFEFEDQQYGLLLNTGEPGAPPNDEPEPVLMKVLTIEGEAAFHMIDDDEEFDRVTSYVKELIADMDEEDEEEKEEDEG